MPQLKNWSPIQPTHRPHIVQLYHQQQPLLPQHTPMPIFNRRDQLQLKYTSYSEFHWICLLIGFYFSIQYTLAQPLNYYNPAASAYQKLAYAPISATSSTPFASPYQQSASQAYASAQASNPNGAIQYASQFYQPAQLNAAKYGYAQQQIPTAQKYFYASS